MAKGQKRSNKEVKKPKQVKPKAGAAASSLTARLSTPRTARRAQAQRSVGLSCRRVRQLGTD